MAQARELDEARARRAVVEVLDTESRRGTGFFIADGLVLTCDHVAGSRSDLLVPIDGEPRPARIVQELSLPDLDLCVLSVAGSTPAVLPVAAKRPAVGELG